MEKEFVSYELAVSLKTLGFDEPCFGFYQLEYGEIRPIMVDDDEQYRLTGFRTCKNSEIPKHYTSAPTFSQAFRWFREKHGLLSLTDHKTSHGWFYRVYFGDNEWYGGFVKYKEAELACLTKLIEIVEQQKQK